MTDPRSPVSPLPPGPRPLAWLEVAAPWWAVAMLVGVLAHPAPGVALAAWFALWALGLSARRARLLRAFEATSRAIDALAPGDAPPELSPTEPESRRAWEAAQSVVSTAREQVLREDEAARRASRQDQATARFTAAMGHELRSPLNSIVGFSQLLQDGGDGPLGPAQHESLAIVRHSAQELLRLLTDVLDSARLDTGPFPLVRAWTPSIEIIDEVIGEARLLTEGRPLQLDVGVLTGLPALHVDRARIVQAVFALVRHAVRGKSEGTIRLSARLDDAGPVPAVRFEVFDPGRILTEHEIGQVFGAFKDLRAATGRRLEGLGLALSLARKLAQLHGGDAVAERRVGAGTAYVIRVPVREPALPPSAMSTEPTS